MPRILALHGHGTSAAIFKAQTASFRAKLPDSYSFEFIDAPFPSSPAAGIAAIYPAGPYYTWYAEQTPSAMRAAITHITAYMAEHGPYDAVCGFSQGCALIGSLLLYHARAVSNTDREDGHGHGDRDRIADQNEQRVPFKAAIFICGGVPLWVLEDLGLPVSEAAREVHKTTSGLLSTTAGRLNAFAADTKLVPRGQGLWDENLGTGALVHDGNVRPARGDVFGLDFTVFPQWATIGIPTGHVYGAKDPRWPAGIQLAELCDEETRVEFDTGGGHDIPRLSRVSEGIAGLVRRVLEAI
ncbi:serine hydrolase FSH [Aspergillus egyptiacus]|nr:serine hydrolase FSH [Aspergillus egyptiacus]